MKLALVLFNLGGPDSPSAVEPFLANLFSDPAILPLPKVLRIPLARLIARRRAPVAGFATIDGALMSLSASVLDESGGSFIEASRTGPADRPRELGRAVGFDLLAKGAAGIIERSRPR